MRVFVIARTSLFYSEMKLSGDYTEYHFLCFLLLLRTNLISKLDRWPFLYICGSNITPCRRVTLSFQEQIAQQLNSDLWGLKLLQRFSECIRASEIEYISLHRILPIFKTSVLYYRRLYENLETKWTYQGIWLFEWIVIGKNKEKWPIRAIHVWILLIF